MSSQPETKPTPSRRLPWWKKVLFGLVTTFGILGLLEIGLRIAGLGGHPKFYQPLPGTTGSVYRAATVDGLIPYFQTSSASDMGKVGSFVSRPLEVPKPRGRWRIVVLGESSVQGFPWPRHLSAPGILQTILNQGNTSSSIEVINGGVTAVASFPIRQIAEEALELEPDAAILYVGHNEFYGAYGVASAQNAGRTPRSMARAHWLRSTALVQGLFRLAQRSQSDPTPEGPQKSTRIETTTVSRSLMEQMATRTDISPTDPLRSAAEKSLRVHLRDIIRLYRSRGVPVVLCTVGSNLRDLRPIRNAPQGGDSEELQRLESALTAAVSRGPQAAAAAAGALLQKFPNHAGGHFVMGRALDMEGRTTEALAAFTQARDLDAMPWRASSALNAMIRKLAQEEGVPLLDMEKEFEVAAGGAPGWDFFADHVHPSQDGQILWAWKMTESLIQNQLVPKSLLNAQLTKPSGMELTEQTRVHSWLAAHLMASLFQREPLKSDQAAYNHWYGEQKRLLERMNPQERQAAMSYLDLASMTPGGNPGSLAGMAADMTLMTGDYAKAQPLYSQAIQESIPLTGRWLYFQWQELYCRYVQQPNQRSTIRQSALNAIREGERILTILPSPTPDLLEAMSGLSILVEDKSRVLQFGKQLPEESPQKQRLLRQAAVLQKLRQEERNKAREGSQN